MCQLIAVLSETTRKTGAHTNQAFLDIETACLALRAKVTRHICNTGCLRRSASRTPFSVDRQVETVIPSVTHIIRAVSGSSPYREGYERRATPDLRVDWAT